MDFGYIVLLIIIIVLIISNMHYRRKAKGLKQSVLILIKELDKVSTKRSKE